MKLAMLAPCLALSAAALIALAVTPEARAAGGSDSATKEAIGTLPMASAPVCVDRIAVSPAILFTQAGGTLLGPSMYSLAIYSNGLIVEGGIDPVTGTTSADQHFVNPQLVHDLQRSLRQMGAHNLCDAQFDALDVPLTTVTIFNGGQDATTHTYSYTIAEPTQRDVQDMIMGFMNANGGS